MQRLLRSVFVLAAALAMASCGGDDGPDVRFLSIGTGGTGGIYYPLGGALASLLSSQDTTRQYTAEVTGGSVENIARIAGGQIDMGFAIGTSTRAAFEGGNDMEPVPGLRVVAPLYPNVAHVLVGSGSGIESVADLAGRTVSVGSAGSGTEQFTRHLLGAYDLDYEDIDERFLSFSESSAALRDGAIDAAILSVGYPAAAVLEATTNATVSLVPVPTADAERLRSSFPFYAAATIPAGTYRGVDADVPTVAVMNWIVGMESLDDEPVTALLDTLYERLQVLVRVNAVAAQVDLGALDDPPIPLHPAAERWLQEHR
jgi:TRAP transporter TAXI family solute receptor